MNAPQTEQRPAVAPAQSEELRYLAYGQLAEEIQSCLRAGQRPDVQALIARHPDLADEIPHLVAALATLHDLGQASRDGSAIAGTLRPDAPALGQLGEFRILGEIGRGGMGVVYEAEQISLGRRVALKVLPFAAVLDPRHLQRFKNEAQAAAALEHPNIVNIYSVGCERGVHYYAMQFIDGQTLAQVIDGLRETTEGERTDKDKGRPGDKENGRREEREKGRKGERENGLSASPTLPLSPSPLLPVSPSPLLPFSPSPRLPVSPSPLAPDTLAAISTHRSRRTPEFFRSVAQLGIQAAEALEHAHQMGVVHRDIKPSNLMVDARGHLWITDFGLAQISAPSPLGGEGRGEGAALTLTGDILGTLRYMSPEQAAGRSRVLDHHTDIYSLGLTVYELLTLRPAFEGDDRQHLVRQILETDPPPPRQHNPSIPRDLETIVLKATAKEPSQRYASAQAMADDLRRYLDDKPIRARRPSLVERAAKWARRHRAVVWSMTTVVAIAAVVCGLVLWNGYRQAVQLERDVGERLAAAQALLASGDYSGADRELAVARGRLDVAAYGEGPLAEGVARLGDDLSARTRAVSRFDQFQQLRHRIHSEMYAADHIILDQAQVHAWKALDLFGMVGADPWQSQADFQNLDTERRATLEEGAIELLFIRARLQKAWSDRQPPGKRAAGYRGALDAFSRIQTFQAPIPAVYLWIADCWEAIGENNAAAEARAKAEAIRPSTAMDHFLLGEYHAHHGRPEQAVASYAQALAQQPDHYLSVLASGVALGKLKRYETAEAMLTGAIAMYPRTTLAYVKRADARWELGKTALALGDLEKARKLDPELARTLTDSAFAFMEARSHDKALTALNDAVRVDPQYARARGVRGTVYMHRKEYDKALADFDQAIRIDPGCVWAYISRAELHLETTGDFDKAFADINEALRIDPKSVLAHVVRGRFNRMKGAWEKSLSDVNEALRLDPLPWVYADRAQIYLEMGDFDKALADYDRAGELRPHLWFHYKRRALAHFRLKQYDKALASIAKAVELNPDDPSNVTWLAPAEVAKCPDERLRKGLLELADKTIERTSKKALACAARARLYSAFGEPDKAMADFDKGVELEPKNSYAWARRARFLAERGDWDRATADFEKAIELGPDDPLQCNNVAWLLVTSPERKVWKPARAVELAKRATQLRPSSGMYWNTLGVAQYRAGDQDAAIRTLSKAMELRSGGDPFDWFFLAMAHWQLGSVGGRDQGPGVRDKKPMTDEQTRHREEARKWYDKAAQWMQERKPQSEAIEELGRFRAEAAELLGKG